MANLVQIYFNTTPLPTKRERHAQAALWARSLDWAAAAGAVMGFAAYQAVVAGASRLIQTVSGVPLAVSAGGTAGSLFGGVVGVTVAGAMVNTVLTAMDTGFDAYLAGKRIGRNGGGGGGEEDIEMERGLFQKRAAYERFP